ncbi:subtilisin-like protein [Auriculariales sp. MPI-PUGE-AT-0066]|nr:subtilisin-like protein [Auriculariales sp. MPI-PUGE-AT-0066]
MRSTSFAFSTLVSLVAIALRGGVRAEDASTAPDFYKSTGVKRGSYIVQLSAPAASKRSEVHSGFLEELDRRANGKFRTRNKYNSDIFTGIVVEFENPDEFVDLATIRNVVEVYPVRTFTAPSPLDVKRGVKPDDPAVAPYGQSVHYMTGVNKVQEQGFTGKGIKVAILDTGIDYNHPMLGGGFGAGFKVERGYDFVGDDYFGDVPQPDDDPYDGCAGHGTHVAGIIAASGPNDFNMTGVAPEATLYAYRVFSCPGYTDTPILVDAAIRAYDDGADIITMSLGGSGPFSNDPFAFLTSQLAEKGRVLTIAAGNDGTAGTLMVSSPASGKEVIAVGSVQNTRILRTKMITNVAHDPIAYYASNDGTNPGTFPLPENRTFPVWIRDDGLGDNNDLCTNADALPADLSEYAVLLRFPRECTFWGLWNQLYTHQFGVLMLWDTHGEGFGYIPGLNFIGISQEADVLWLIDQTKNGNITVSFPQQEPFIEIPNSNPGLMSYYSGMGPSADMLFKPAISAPGGAITSTLPLVLGGWAVYSGTSMATPYVAGSAALILQAKGLGAAKQIRSLLQTSARGLPQTAEKNSLPDSLAKQGAGIIDVYSAINSVASVSPAELLLNDTANWKKDHVITIKNGGKKAETYTVWHEPAGTVVSMPDGINYKTYPVDLVAKYANVHLSKTRVTLLPGASAKVALTITPPADVNPNQLPLVSGWVHVNALSYGGDRLRVSYMGFAGKLKDAQVISTGNDYYVPLDGGLPAILKRSGEEQNGPFRATRGPTNWTEDGPVGIIAIAFAQPSRRITWDLIDANTNIKSTIPDPLDSAPATKRGVPSWWPTPAGARKPSTSYDSVPIVGPIYELTWFGRNGVGAQSVRDFIDDWLPRQFMNGTAVPNGQYRYLIRALRITGDPAKLEDYDIYVSQQFGYV